MREIITKIYAFDELSPEAQKVAIEANRYVNLEGDFYLEDVAEYFKESTVDDFVIDKIYFNGFSFSAVSTELYCEAIDSLTLPEWKKSVLKSLEFEAIGEGRQFRFDIFCKRKNILNLINNSICDIEDYILKKYRSACHKLASMIDSDRECLASDEAVIETLQRRGEIFSENGDMLA